MSSSAVSPLEFESAHKVPQLHRHFRQTLRGLLGIYRSMRRALRRLCHPLDVLRNFR